MQDGTQASGSPHAIILGQGNVALDCARILAKRPQDLATTDICQHALAVLAKSRVSTISVIGRRGHGQAAFTIKELRELTRIDGATCIVDPAEIQLGLTDFTIKELEASRPRKRLADLLQTLPAEPVPESTRTVALRFLLMPKAFLPDKTKPHRVGAIVMERAKLEVDSKSGRVVASPTGHTLELPCHLALRSIGYRSVPLEGVPFDARKATIHNCQGRVLEMEGSQEQVPGLYCTGWVKRGPTGIINTNIVDARETVAAILEDHAKGKLPLKGSDASPLLDIVEEAGHKTKADVVTWEGYRQIDAYERKIGEEKGKPREKVIDTQQLMRLASGSSSS